MTPAAIALAEFKRRQAKPVPNHEARLRPWAAIALRAGAALADLPRDLGLAYEDYRRANLSDGQARAAVADDLCPLADARAELARVRDAGLEGLPDDGSATPAALDAVRRLVRLANHFNAPPYRPAPGAQGAAGDSAERDAA